MLHQADCLGQAYIDEACDGGPQPFVNGQEFDTDNYNVIVDGIAEG
jgi:hypothetical protein